MKTTALSKEKFVGTLQEQESVDTAVPAVSNINRMPARNLIMVGTNKNQEASVLDKIVFRPHTMLDKVVLRPHATNQRKHHPPQLENVKPTAITKPHHPTTVSMV